MSQGFQRGGPEGCSIVTQGQCIEGVPIDRGGRGGATCTDMHCCSIEFQCRSNARRIKHIAGVETWLGSAAREAGTQRERERKKKPENHSGGASGCVCSEASPHVSPRLTRRRCFDRRRQVNTEGTRTGAPGREPKSRVLTETPATVAKKNGG